MLLRSFGATLGGERPHLVLEHIDGPRLSTLLRRYGMSLEQLLPLALNLCAVLHYLAHERVVHLDVKPSNIIMGGEPRLIDLSVARRIDELHELRSPVGTELWMAPEQRDVDRFGEIGPASDVWGLGATLRAAMPERVPVPVADAVAACLDPRPTDRPTADELARMLEPLVDALPAPRLGRFRPSPRKRIHIRRYIDDHRTTGRTGPRRSVGARRPWVRVRRARRRRRRRRRRAGDRTAQGDAGAELVSDDDDEGDGDDTRGDDRTARRRQHRRRRPHPRQRRHPRWRQHRRRRPHRGNDGTRGGDNTGDGDRTRATTAPAAATTRTWRPLRPAAETRTPAVATTPEFPGRGKGSAHGPQ